MPYHHPKNRPNQPTSQRSRHLPRIRPRPHHSRRPPTYPRHPIRDRKNPTKSAPFMKPSTCPSRKKVARNLTPTPFTAHCHPAYQVSMNSEDTPPLTKLCVSSVTYPPHTRRSPATCPPSGAHAPRTSDRFTSGIRHFRAAALILCESRVVTPCGQSSATRAAAGDKFPKRPMPALKLSAMARR